MVLTPFLADEAARLQTLEALKVLDTPADPVLDGLVRSAAAAIGCPISLVSLVDARRQWIKARVGLELTEIARQQAFCAHAVAHADGQGGLFEVPDATQDARFVDNALVTGAPQLRFYAGVPLRVDGHSIGTLCVADTRPRRLDAAQRDLLIDLARAAEHCLLSRREQHQLREVEAYRHSLFEQLGDGVLLLDREHRVLDANQRALAMLGHRRDALLRLRLHDVLAAFEHRRLDTVLPILADGAPYVAEWEGVRHDGSHFPVEVSVRPLDSQRYIIVVRDISHRHAQEQQLRQLSLAVEQSSESIVITDLAGDIEYVNAAALASSGYAAAELLGRNSRILQSGKTSAETYRAMWAGLTRGQPWKGPLFNRRKDGSEYVEFAVITPIRKPDGRITQYLAVKEDVTEKRRMGEELDQHRHHLEELVAQRTAELALATRAAEAANEAKSAFLATMSHEIRTPMNGVVGIVDVLCQSSLTPYQAELAATMRESAFALLRIIDDILDFSKIEAGHLALETEPVALLRLVEGACDGLQPVAAGRGVALQVFVDPRLPDTIVTDALRLRQILNNLLGNAIKFSAGLDRPGQVRLRVEPAAGGRLRLLVNDNGIGIAPEVQARIFQPFVQAEGSTTRRYGGTGLGLSICRRLVELFDGSIEVASTPGVGTTFSVTLPMNALESHAAAVAVADLAGLDCHVALRDALQANDWCTYLTAVGAHARAWPDAAALRAALATNAGERPLVIIETCCEGTTGEHLWSAAGGATLPVVHVSGGQRRGPRLLGPGDVLLDVGLVHRAALLQAVALAAGRVVPQFDDLVSEAAPSALTPPSIDEAATQGRLVLVAEDNEINQIVLHRQLALLGIAAEIADDGLDALTRWRSSSQRKRYGLLLTDLHMPGIDGYELTTAIRRDEAPGQRLPIVALTANALRGEAERCRAAGMDDYLSKPVPLKQLKAILDRWLPVAPGEPPSSRAEPPLEAFAETAQEPGPTVLPAVAAEAAALLTRAAAEGVVLVDDEPFQIKLLQRQLALQGVAPVQGFTSGTLALEWLEQRDTSSLLLLLDLTMPGMDGVEFMRHLAERRYAGALALVSGTDARLLQTATKLAGAYQLNVLSHLHKPVPADSLCRLIERWRGFTPAQERRIPKVYGPKEVENAIGARELVLHFQPKVALADGAWVGVEALVRWLHPTDGLLYPDSFVGVAEAHGQIHALTRAVLEQALAQARRWRDAGLVLRLAVNVSMDNLARLDFPEFLLGETARHGVQPTDLMLEVTESRLMHDARAPMDILTRLRLNRIGLSIDDFGTGHSSLAQLRDLPFDELKIDRGFVHDSSGHSTQRAIFNASLDMAHQLGMTAVAEGVEDRADWDFVRAAGCDMAQGYFVARPMPADALADWAAQWRQRFAAL